MMSQSTATVIRYNNGARLFHWTIALLVIMNLAIGLGHDALEGVVSLMPVHKATGILILALTLGRIVWRLAHGTPALPSSVSGWERQAARASHAALYALMLFMPLTGWMMSSAGPRPISFYGLFDVPKFAIERGTPLASAANNGHGLLGWLLLALVILHVAAAMRHHFILKDAVLRRML